jgi:tRNA modification GTPase
MDRAELIVAVFDGGTLPEPEDMRLAERLAASRVPVLAVMNKTDVGHPGAEAALSRLVGVPLLLVSALHGTGMEALVEAIVEKATHASGRGGNAMILTNARHRQLLEQAEARLLEAREACRAGQTQDVLAFLVREAWQLMGRVLGEDASEELLNSIFSRFCLGK